MNISVASCIADLLYERDSIILPGFGGFVTTYQGSDIDQVQGIVQPPAKQVRINPNLVLDDGVLTKFIQEKFEASEREAKEAITSFVEQLNLRLRKKEIITIPEVGKIYLDFENQLKFLPEKTNFNKSAFGLPSVGAYPVLRNKTEAIEKAKSNLQPAPKIEYAPIREEQKKMSYNLSKWLIPAIIAVSIAVIGFSIYMLWFERDTDQIEINESNNSRLNIKPALTEPDAKSEIIPTDSAAITDNSKSVDSIHSTNNKTLETESKGEETVPETQYANKNLGVVIIGGFNNKRNADNLVEKIYDKGYNAYTDKHRGLRRIGIQFPYENKEELNKMLLEIQDKFNPNAWILSE